MGSGGQSLRRGGGAKTAKNVDNRFEQAKQVFVDGERNKAEKMMLKLDDDIHEMWEADKITDDQYYETRAKISEFYSDVNWDEASAVAKYSGGGKAAVQAQAVQRLNNMPSLKIGQSYTISNGEYSATVTKVRPGYQNRSAGSTMYSVNIVNSMGERVFSTNRRGGSALREAKDDIRQHLGLRKR